MMRLDDFEVSVVVGHARTIAEFIGARMVTTYEGRTRRRPGKYVTRVVVEEPEWMAGLCLAVAAIGMTGGEDGFDRLIGFIRGMKEELEREGVKGMVLPE